MPIGSIRQVKAFESRFREINALLTNQKRRNIFNLDLWQKLQVAGFKSGTPAGFRLEKMAGFVLECMAGSSVSATGFQTNRAPTATDRAP